MCKYTDIYIDVGSSEGKVWDFFFFHFFFLAINYFTLSIARQINNSGGDFISYEP